MVDAPSFRDLIDFISPHDEIFIQPHDFPDHDSISAAFGLQYLLSLNDIEATIIYEGAIQRDSLARMMSELGITAKQVSEVTVTASSKIIMIDGCLGNKNITELPGAEIAIIDHHQSTAPEHVPFRDIRSEYGSTSTIIYNYSVELDTELPSKVATALMIGLLLDTAHLMRGAGKEDITCYAALYDLADNVFVNSVLRNNVQQQDLYYFNIAFQQVSIQNRFAFCYFPDGCNQNLLGIIADFFLSIQEVNFVFMCAKNGDRINLSLRSEKEEWNSVEIIRVILGGIVFGGGHHGMAGGIIMEADHFDEKQCFNELKKLLGITAKTESGE